MPVVVLVAALLLAMAGCRMTHVEAAKQPVDPAQTSPGTEAGELTGPEQSNQSAQGGVATAVGAATLSIAGASAAESDRALRFTVTLSRAVSTPVTVAYETADGSATAVHDYEAASGRLTFPAESTAARQIEVPLRNDRISEPTETLTLNLRSAQGATLAMATAAGTITDDDPRALAVQPAKLPVPEGDAASFAVSLASQPTAEVTVSVTAPSASELTVVPDRLVFTPENWSEARTVTLTAAQDNDALADAPAELAVAASGGGYDVVPGSTVTAVIVEDDTATLAIAAADASEDERRIRFEVTLSRASNLAVTVNFATESTGQTAAEWEDYVPVSGTLRFPPGTTAAQPIDVTLTDDDLDEDSEAFTLSLSNPGHAALAGGGETLNVTGSIRDQDALPVVSIGDVRLAEGAGGGSMLFPVRLRPASGRAVTVRYATANVTAAAGADYARGSGTVTFAAGATERTVAVPIADDVLDEEDTEQFSVTLQAPVHATVHTTQGSGTGTVEDNDPEPALSIAGGALTEGSGDGTMRFAVTLAPASGRTVTVKYETSDVTATAGNDYAAASGTLTIRAGGTAASIAVPVFDDAAGEQTETFTVTLRAPDGASLAAAAATGTISDNGDATRLAAASAASAPPELASLLVTGGAGTMYPAFDAGIRHYALTCGDSTTLSITARAVDGDAQLTLLRADTDDDEVASGTLETQITVDADHDVAVEISDGGGTATYVVHCLPAAFPDIAILANTDQVKDGLLLVAPTYGGYSTHTTFLAVLDNNGVPRFHRRLTTARADDEFWALDFKAHGKGRYSVSRRPAHDLSDSAFGNWEIDLLDERFRVTSTMQTVAPLSHTDGHDFLVAANGDYVMLSYYTDPDGRDFSPYGGSETEATRDSVIQRRTKDGESRFTWNSWDHRDVLRAGNDCRVGLYPDTYAHLNGLQLLADGDYVASFRGCSSVLRIDGSTGAVEWKLGGTAPPADSGTRFLAMIDAANVVEEFCGQHQVTLTSSDTVVMFDNGTQCLGDRKDAAPFSRAVEYDISSGTQAELLREYRLPERYGYFPYEGGVSVLDDFGGSVHWLISWGTKGTTRSGTVTPREAIAISEVDPATGTAHLHVNMTKGDETVWTYRAYRVPESDVTVPLNLP